MQPLAHLIHLGRARVFLLLILVLVIGSLPAAANTLADYNPRYDVNSDGTIDVVDIALVASAWNTNGTPANDHELIVAKQGGEYNSITAALNSITDNGPSSTYLVRVLPGVYEEQVVMKSYVHLQGAGPGITIISNLITGTLTLTGTATLRGAANARVSDLTVRHLGAGNTNVGIYNDGNDFVVDNVQVQVANGATCYGIYVTSVTQTTIRRADVRSTCSDNNYGIYNISASPTIADSKVAVNFGTDENFAIRNGNSLTAIRDTTVSADGAGDNYGIYSASSTITIDGGVLDGTTASIFTLSDATSRISAAQLANGKNGAGTYACVGAFNASYTALSATCD